MPAEPQIPGMAQLRARGSVADAWARLEAAVAERHLTVFARIDFAGDAAAAGLTLHPMRMLVFGNPRAGTPVFAAAPTAAIDLPLHILVWESDDGAAVVGYNTPAYLAARHGIPELLRPNLEPVATLAAIAAGAAT